MSKVWIITVISFSLKLVTLKIKKKRKKGHLSFCSPIPHPQYLTL